MEKAGAKGVECYNSNVNSTTVAAHYYPTSDQSKLQQINYYHATNGYCNGQQQTKPDIEEQQLKEQQIISENEVSSTTEDIK